MAVLHTNISAVELKKLLFPNSVLGEDNEPQVDVQLVKIVEPIQKEIEEAIINLHEEYKIIELYVLPLSLKRPKPLGRRGIVCCFWDA